MANSTVTLKATGLITSPNELSRDEGSLIQADNVIIKRDGVIEQRRGFGLYGSALPSIGLRVKQLTTYRNRILRHYSDKLAFDSDGDGRFLDFAGSFIETQPGLRMKFIESNGNFYFTTSTGIKKISARTADDLLTVVPTSAGAVKAVDLTGRVLYTPNSQSGFLPQDAAVAYRVVWGYKDLNNNLVLGAPSQRLVVSNPMKDLLIHDYMRLLDTLDSLTNTPLTTARIDDYTYVQTLGMTLADSAATLRTNLIALTSKLDNDIFIADSAAVAPLQIASAAVASNILTITFTASPAAYLFAGDHIFLGGTWTGAGAENLSGAQTIVSVVGNTVTINVTAANGAVVLASPTIVYNEFRNLTQPSEPSAPPTNDELVELQTYFENILTTLVDLPTAILSTTDNTSVNALDVTTTATVELTITIPQGVDSNYFFQVYRSAIAQAIGAATFDDVVPSDELQLVYEAYPTVPELEIREIILEDVTPDAFRGANLYTNAGTGEGILQANDIPPFAKDINRYRNSVFYANTRTLHRMSLNLLGVSDLLTAYASPEPPVVTIASDISANTYHFVAGQQEIYDIITVADVANSLDGTYFELDSKLNQYYIWFATSGGTNVDPAVVGRTGVRVNLTTGDSANNVGQKLRNKLSTLVEDFIITGTLSTVTIRQVDPGYVMDIADFNTGFAFSVVQTGRGERVQPQITLIETVAGNLYTTIGTADYFTINATSDAQKFFVWFNAGTVTAPVLPGYTSVEITVTGLETAPQVAINVANALPTAYFTTSQIGNEVAVTNKIYGYVSAPVEVVADAGFTVVVAQTGALDVLISPLTSPAQAVDETARSFVRVINKNPGEIIYGYYLSSAFDVPGKMLLESRDLAQDDPFYLLANTDEVGASFNPDIGPEGAITNISVATNTVITTDVPHGMITGDKVVIGDSDSTPRVDGVHTITRLSTTSFSIPRSVNIAGSDGSFIRATTAVFSENEERANRVYFSKFLQPDAVPIANFFDVGAQDKAILRIFPLRDSLFVFKEDGLYRISGESAPFQLELFDNSFIVLAPDSVSVANNVIYAWTTQGIQSLTEGGSSIISRNIDNIVLRLQSANFTNFKTVTWGTGYESDNSYIVFTVVNMGDTFAHKGYRYSTLTNSWSNYTMGPVAGTVNPADDKLYLAANDVPFIEQERKTFSRLDYADREYTSVISTNKVIGNKVILPSVTQFDVGDVIVQDQTITTVEFNIVLTKLDNDSTVADTDYFATLALVTGASPRIQLDALAAKLDADTGVVDTDYASTIASKNGVITSNTEESSTVITSVAHGLLTGRVILIDSSDSTPSINGTHIVTVIDADTFSIPVQVTGFGSAGNWQTVDLNFQDLKTCYNTVMEKLNDDNGVAFTNYRLIDNNTIQESIIIAINRITKQITLNLSLQYLVGEVTIFKAIDSVFAYSPITFGDPVSLKHLAEATLMFETRTITGGILSFATDLLPEFQSIPFTLDGNGIFGHVPNFGDGFFGGFSNAAPFRTFIPRQCQRCRYIIVKFNHKTAREDYRINGTTLSGTTGLSIRAFR